MWSLPIRSLSLRTVLSMALLFMALNALGQSKPAPGVISKPSSTTTTPKTKPASVPQESDLERELNQSNSVPGRLGPSPSNQNKVPSNVVTRPAVSDSVRLRQKMATADSIRFAALKQIQVSELQPKRIRSQSVRLPIVLSRIVRPIPATPINIDSIRIATRNARLRDSLSAIQANPLQPKQAKSTPSPAIGLPPRVVQPPAATPLIQCGLRFATRPRRFQSKNRR